MNAQDEALLLLLSHPDIRIVGPRGTAQGHEVLAAWLGRAGLYLETERVFAKGDAAVFAQRGVWQSVGTDEPQGEAEVASSSVVRNGQVVQIARFDTLADALAHAGLGDAAEVLS